MARGQKSCPQCHKITGPRTYKCECGYEFPIKSKATSATQTVENAAVNATATKAYISREDVDLALDKMLDKFGTENILREMYNRAAVKAEITGEKKYAILRQHLKAGWIAWKGE